MFIILFLFKEPKQLNQLKFYGNIKYMNNKVYGNIKVIDNKIT